MSAADGERRIGPYRLEAPVGRGGMGEVYRAFDERLGRRVALKRLRTDRVVGEEGRRRFRREARAIAALDHPAIVGIHDLLETGDGDWIVMEWVDGESLAERLSSGRLDPGEALELGRQLAAALGAAHARGVLHRDVKAENVLVTASGRARLLDFGLAKTPKTPSSASAEDSASGAPSASAGDLTVEGGVLGTFRAMSPEQSRGLEVTPASDLFALGVLLYEMLAGSSPFRGSDAVETVDRLRRHRQRPVAELAPEVPPAVSDLVDRLLEKDPAHRPASAEAVAAELAALGDPDQGRIGEEEVGESMPWAAESTVSFVEPPDSPGGESGNFAPRSRLAGARLGVAVLGLAALLSGAAFFLGLWPPAGDPPPGAAPTRPLYVAVAEPEMHLEAPPEGLDLLAPAARGAVFRGLLALDGVAPLVADRLEGAGDPRALARALAASEVVTSRLDCAEESCRVSLQRLAGDDGRVLWSEDFEVPASDLSLLDSALAGHLRRAYPEKGPRAGLRRRSLGGEHWRRLLRLRLDHLQRSRPGEEIFADLEALRVEAPAAPEIYWLQAEVAHDLYFYSRRQEDLERVFERLEGARSLDPADPEPLLRLSRVALEAGRLEVARRAIEQLDDLAPGDARVEMRRALLFERQGEGERAMSVMRSSIERHPAWQALFELAALCYRRSDPACARRSLERLLDRVPGNAAAESFLAQLELTTGDPRRAEELYTSFVEGTPGVAELSNLGLARMLLGRFDAAAASFAEALELDAENPFTLLNLADAEQLAGRLESARGLYRRVLEVTIPGGGEAGWQRSTARAQALAHLGHRRAAVAEVQKALRLAGEHPQAAFEAAVVYAVLDEPTSALVNAERARGVFGPRWFELPWFDALGGEPGFRRLEQPAL